MRDLLDIDEFELACAEASVKPVVVLKRAGVFPANWYRWRDGKTSPSVATMKRVTATLRGIASETQSAA